MLFINSLFFLKCECFWVTCFGSRAFLPVQRNKVAFGVYVVFYFSPSRYFVVYLVSVVFLPVWGVCIIWHQPKRVISIHRSRLPGIVDRTFGNRTQSNSIRWLNSIEFGNRTKSNTELCVSSISETIELNRTQPIRLSSIKYGNRSQSNIIQWTAFDCVR